jgi:serine/threonine protein kinase/Tfp pilus assembly protein PilF
LNPIEFERIRELLIKVVDLPADEQRLYLEDSCKDDPKLLKEIELILARESDDQQAFKSTVGIPFSAVTCLDMTGRTFHHFHLEEKIASGGMGVLYKAIDTKLCRYVAIKILRPELLSHPGIRERFIREAQAASALNHPGIVTVYEINEDSGVDYIVMEFVEGRTLDEVISSEGLPLEAVSAYAISLAKTLRFAHEKGIVHRDLKPSNIMVTEEGDLKILDFGIAKRLDTFGFDENEALTVTQVTQTRGVLGTVGYMSPEQVRGREVDHRSDIFSFGVVLYEMITGETPFQGDSVFTTTHAILHDDPKPFSDYQADLPDTLEAIVYRALQKDREDRYQATEDLVEDLQCYRLGEELQYAPPVDTVKRRLEVRSLAVLYLKNLGPEDDEHLSYGITEDLIIDLTRIGILRVAPMHSILRHKDSNVALEEIAEQLDVTMVLDGSIHRSESSVRVTAQLVDIEMGKNLWANRWEEPLEDLPKVKQLLAQGISRALNVDAANVGVPETQDPRAYEYYLRAKYTFEHWKDEADLEVALGLFRQALSLEPSLMAACAGVAHALMLKNEYEEADQLLTSALVDARRRGHRADEADILRLFSLLRDYQSRWDEALDYGEQALEIKKELNDLAGEALVLGDLIGILNGRSRYAEALEMSKRLLEIHRQLDDQEKSADGLRRMGGLYKNMGDYDKAMACAEEAQVIARRCGNLSVEAACTADIGIIYKLTGNLDKALQCHEQVLQIDTKLGNQEGRATSFNNIAVAHISLGNYRKAIEMLDQASMIQKEIGYSSGNALTLTNIADIYSRIGEYDRAIEAARQALAIAEELDYPLIIAVANLNLGSSHLYKDEYKTALECFLNALDVSNRAGLPRYIIWSHTLLGELHYHQGEYDKCHEHSEKARTMSIEIGEMETMLKASAYLVALMVQKGHLEEGVRELSEVCDTAREVGDPIPVINARRLLGQSLLEHGRNESEREEGRTILEEALAMAQEKEVAYEVEWICEILNR